MVRANNKLLWNEKEVVRSREEVCRQPTSGALSTPSGAGGLREPCRPHVINASRRLSNTRIPINHSNMLPSSRAHLLYQLSELSPSPPGVWFVVVRAILPERFDCKRRLTLRCCGATTSFVAAAEGEMPGRPRRADGSSSAWSDEACSEEAEKEGTALSTTVCSSPRVFSVLVGSALTGALRTAARRPALIAAAEWQCFAIRFAVQRCGPE